MVCAQRGAMQIDEMDVGFIRNGDIPVAATQTQPNGRLESRPSVKDTANDPSFAYLVIC
jgi:hypothetical protein